MSGAKPIADCGLAFGETVEVAHALRSLTLPERAFGGGRRLENQIDATVPASWTHQCGLRGPRGASWGVGYKRSSRTSRPGLSQSLPFRS